MNLKLATLSSLAAAVVASCLFGQQADASPLQAATTTGSGSAPTKVPAQAAPSSTGGQQTTPSSVNPGSAATTKPSSIGTSQAPVKKKTGPKKKVKATPPPPPAKPAWQEFTLNPKKTLSLDFTDASADMVLSIFSKASGITILKDPGFKSTLTLNSAKAVHLDDAFEILNTELDLNGYSLQKRGKLMVVVKSQPPAPPVVQAGPPPMPPPAPAEEKTVLAVYKLKYTNAREIARVVNEVFTQQQLEALIRQAQGQGQQGGFPGQPQFGGQPQGPQPPKIVRASSEDYSNQVVVSAPPSYQTEVVALIKELDIATDLPLESKIFTLQHVAADDIIEAVNNVLAANTPTGKGAAKAQDQNQNQFFGYYGRFGGGQSTPSAGAQTATAIKESNSLVVAATHDNIEVITKLIQSLDVVSNFVGTTNVIQLKNAKATDMANLLNQAFTKKKDQNNDNPFFYVYSDSPQGDKKEAHDVDTDENGMLVHVRDLTGKVNIMADPNTNSLIVVTIPSNLPLIRKVVDQLDKIGDQVMIEAVIVEATLDKTTKLGVEWNFLQNKAFGSSNLVGAGSNTYGLQNSTTPNTGFIYTLTGQNYNIFLNALETDSRLKVLDTPRIFTSNNVTATINVSTQEPYITNQQTATAFGGLIQNYDFKNIGVVLKVTPRIASSGQVAMDIDQTADDLQGFTSYNAPIINHREATTSATVLNGETIVLGGIIEHGLNTTENKIPLLGDLPLLGPLFRSTSHEKTQTELLVFLTPHIVHNNEDAQKLREEATHELSRGSQNDLKKH
jgi:general secretion pathway protein D